MQELNKAMKVLENLEKDATSSEDLTKEKVKEILDKY
jgi:hypothetical protein